jgi:cohesin complex subunit SCC1
LHFVFVNSDVDIQAQLSLNQSRAEEITMREDYGSLSLPHHDEGFGDLDFNEDAPELLRDQPPAASFDDRFDDRSHELQRSHKDVLNDDGFGGPLGQDMMGMFCIVGLLGFGNSQ